MWNIWPQYLQGIFTVHILNHTKYIVTGKCFLEYFNTILYRCVMLLTYGLNMLLCKKGLQEEKQKCLGITLHYKFIEGTLYHFDDAIVNSTQMLSEYETNLIFYWRADIPPYAWDIDFGFITYKTPELYGRKPYSLRGTLAISNDLKEGTGDNQPVFPEAVAITMMSEADSLHKDKDELNVNNKITDKNNTPQTESDTKACDDQVLESTNPDKGNIPQHQNDIGQCK